MAEDGIFIPIEVRLSKLDAGLREAEAKIAASSKKMESTAGGGATGFAVKSLYVIGGIKATLALIEAGTAAWKARQSEVNGRIEEAHAGYMKVVDAVKSVPIAGEIVFKIANVFTGWSDDIEDAMTKIQMMTKDLDAAKAAADRFKSAMATSGASAESSNTASYLVGSKGFDLEQKQAEIEYLSKVAAANKTSDAANTFAEGSPQRKALKDQADKEYIESENLLLARIEDINKRMIESENEASNKSIVEHAVAVGEKQKKADEAAKKKLEAEAKNQKDLADLRSQATEKALRAQGRDKEAEAESIRRQYQDRIAVAKAGGQEEQAALLEIMRDMDVAAATAKGGSASAGRGMGFGTVSNYRGSGSTAVPFAKTQPVNDQLLTSIAKRILTELQTKKPATAG